METIHDQPAVVALVARGLFLLALALGTLTAVAPHRRGRRRRSGAASLYPKTTDLDRALSAKNLGNLGLAMHNYHDANGALPGAAIFDKNGKPLLSWRVAILPYIEQERAVQAVQARRAVGQRAQQEAHREDAEDLRPDDPGQADQAEHDVLSGLHRPRRHVQHQGQPGHALRQDVTDGTSNTAMIVEAADAGDLVEARRRAV